MTSTTLPLHGAEAGDVRDCPYQGLRPYTEDDGDYFFGRDAERDIVVANAMANRLTVLYGPSGVGKSSLLQAGVLRELRSLSDSSYGFMAAERTLAVYFSDWRDDPLRDLATALSGAIAPGPDRDALFSGRPGLTAELLDEVSRRLDTDIYLILDQFEEEAQYQGGSRGEEFAAELGRIVALPGRRVSVLLGLREDALARLDRFARYIPGIFDNYLRLDHLDDRAAREAIEAPILRFNRTVQPSERVSLEPALVDQLLVELRTGRVTVAEGGKGGVDGSAHAIETAFLQLVLNRLWIEEVEVRGSRVLRASTLTELGGCQEIVRTHLDRVMADLTPDQQQLAAQVFRHLVTPSGTKFAHTAADLADVEDVADVALLEQVMERLSSGRERVLRPVPAPMDRPGPERYEIFHDVMAPAILDWRRRFIAEQERLAAVRETQRAADEQALQLRARRRRRRRFVLVVFALLVVAAVVVSVAVVSVRNQARTQRNAEVDAQLALAKSELTIDPAKSLRTALAVLDTSGIEDTHAGLARIAVGLALERDHNRLLLDPGRGEVTATEYSPDGSLLAVATIDGNVEIRDGLTGVPRTELTPSRPAEATAPVAVNAVSFSPDGSMVATLDQLRTAVVYDVQAGVELARRTGRTAAGVGYGTMAWHSLGGEQLLAVAQFGQPVVLWNPRSDAASALDEADTGSVAVAFSDDGRRIVTAGVTDARTFRTRVWDVESRSELASLPSGPNYLVAIGFSDDGDTVTYPVFDDQAGLYRLAFWDWQAGTEPTFAGPPIRVPSSVIVKHGLVVVTADQTATVIQPADDAGQRAWNSVPIQPDWVYGADISDDGRWLVTSGADGRVLVWSATHPVLAPTAELLGHAGPVAVVHFLPGDRHRLVSGGTDGKVRTWEIPTAIDVDQEGWVWSNALSPDGSRIATASEIGALRVWSAADGSLQYGPARVPVVDNNHLLRFVDFLPDGEQVAAVTHQAAAPVIWRFGDGSDPRPLDPLPNDDVARPVTISSDLAISSDGTRVSAGTSSNQLVTWAVGAGNILSTMGEEHFDRRINMVATVPGSDITVTAGSRGEVAFWRPGEQAPVRTIQYPGDLSVAVIDVSADGQYVVTVGVDHQVRVYRVADGELVSAFEGPQSSIGYARFSPDGRLLAIGTANGDVPVWDWNPEDPQQIALLHRQGSVVSSVDWAADSRTVLSGSNDGTAVLGACVPCEPFDELLEVARYRDAHRTP